MADKTAIEWTDATWNPTVGCSIVSKGCTNCYAMKMAARLEAMGQPIYRGLTKPSKAGPVWTGTVRLNPAVLTKPLSWRRPRRIFVNSMSDLFHEALSDKAIDQVFAVMALCPQHTFQVLTKRPERMRAYMRGVAEFRAHATVKRFARLMPLPFPKGWSGFEWPLPNVWAGVSVEDQATADARIPILLRTPAAKRFISAEPLLGPVDLRNLTVARRYGTGLLDALTCDFKDHHGQVLAGPPSGTGPLDWVIAGGESGPDARPAHPDWFRSLRDQCAAAGVPYFFKQWGEYHPSDQHDPDTRPCDATPDAIHISGRREFRPFEAGELIVTKKAEGWAGMCRVGKKAAGALLDGREHREFPR